MISVDVKSEKSHSSPLNLSSTEEEPTISFSQLLKGVKSSKSLIQNGTLVLAIEDVDTQKPSLNLKADLAQDNKKSESLSSLLKNNDKTEISLEKEEPLELHSKITTTLNTKEIKVLVKDAKEYLKNKILQSDEYKKSSIKELPNTIKGLVKIAKEFNIDVKKITVEDVQIKDPKAQITTENKTPLKTLDIKQEVKPTVKPEIKVDLRDALNSTKEVKQEVKAETKTDSKIEIAKEVKPELKAEIKTQTPKEIKPEVQAQIKVQTPKEIKPEVQAQIKVQTPKEIKPEVQTQIKTEIKHETKIQAPKEVKVETKADTKILNTKEIKPEVIADIKPEPIKEIKNDIASLKSTPLFKAQTVVEPATTEQIVQVKSNTNVKVENKTPKEKADETLKLLLRGEKPTINTNLTADFSVATAKVLVSSTPSEATKSLESLLHGDSSNESTHTAGKTEQLTSLKSDSFEVKLNEAKQMIKYISTDVKTAIEDYKSPFTRVKVQLNPKNLGEVDLTIVQRGKNLHVNISSNNAAINTLNMNANELRTQLSNNGINNASLNFSNSSENGSSFNEQQNRQQEHKQAKEEYNFFDNEETNEEVLNSLEIVVANYA